MPIAVKLEVLPTDFSRLGHFAEQLAVSLAPDCLSAYVSALTIHETCRRYDAAQDSWFQRLLRYRCKGCRLTEQHMMRCTNHYIDATVALEHSPNEIGPCKDNTPGVSNDWPKSHTRLSMRWVDIWTCGCHAQSETSPLPKDASSLLSARAI